jgi:hypothetical protein
MDKGRADRRPTVSRAPGRTGVTVGRGLCGDVAAGDGRVARHRAPDASVILDLDAEHCETVNAWPSG